MTDWSRFDACQKCSALGGEPCTSLAPQHAGTVVAVAEPHAGRPKVAMNGHAPTVTTLATAQAPDPQDVFDIEVVEEVTEPEPVEEPEPKRKWDWVRISCVGVATFIGGVAASVSYRHALEVSRMAGESGWTSYFVPLTIDGLVYVASMVLLNASRQGTKAGWLAYGGLWLGILATVAVNVTHGWSQGIGGALIAAWPAVTLVIVVELLQRLFRKAK